MEIKREADLERGKMDLIWSVMVMAEREARAAAAATAEGVGHVSL